jgi:hypothetical protein
MSWNPITQTYDYPAPVKPPTEPPPPPTITVIVPPAGVDMAAHVELLTAENDKLRKQLEAAAQQIATQQMISLAGIHL